MTNKVKKQIQDIKNSVTFHDDGNKFSIQHNISKEEEISLYKEENQRLRNALSNILEYAF